MATLKQMAKRASWRELSESHRAKIKVSQIINRLNSAALGDVEMSNSQIRAALGLLGKVMPDLSASEITKVDERVSPTEILAKLKEAVGDEAFASLEKDYTPVETTYTEIH